MFVCVQGLGEAQYLLLQVLENLFLGFTITMAKTFEIVSIIISIRHIVVNAIVFVFIIIILPFFSSDLDDIWWVGSPWVENQFDPVSVTLTYFSWM